MTSGKHRGNQFERDVCRKLSLWWSYGKRDDIFWRSDSSGARATSRNKSGKSAFGQYGDVAAVDPIGLPLIKYTTIECKSGYNGQTVADIFDCGPHNKQQTWEKWIEKAITDSEAAGSETWWLITHRRQRQDMIWMPTTHLHRVVDISTLENPIIDLHINTKHMKFTAISGCQFNNLLKAAYPKTIKHQVKVQDATNNH